MFVSFYGRRFRTNYDGVPRTLSGQFNSKMRVINKKRFIGHTFNHRMLQQMQMENEAIRR